MNGRGAAPPLRGSANGALLLREVSASYDCGAHGDSALRFSPIDLTKAANVDEAARASQVAAVKAKIPEIFGAAEAELTKREADAEHDELFAWAIAAADAFVPELGLGEIPAAVKLTDEGRKATNAKDYVAAVAAFDAAIAADAKASRAYSGRGHAKLLSKDLDGAKSDFERALELASDPRFQGAVWFNLGLVAEAQEDAAGAKAAFQKVLTFGPSQAARKKLDALH